MILSELHRLILKIDSLAKVRSHDTPIDCQKNGKLMKTSQWRLELYGIPHLPTHKVIIMYPVVSTPGQLKLWVDIMTEEEASRKPAEPLYPPLPLDYEIRVRFIYVFSPLFEHSCFAT